MMSERGEIRNKKLVNQARDFRGLRWGKITPTDIDGFIDFGNHAHVCIELKHAGAKVPFGQKLALERMSDASRVPLIVIVAEHNTDGDIDVAMCPVISYYSTGKWHTPDTVTNTRGIIDSWLASLNNPALARFCNDTQS